MRSIWHLITSHRFIAMLSVAIIVGYSAGSAASIASALYTSNQALYLEEAFGNEEVSSLRVIGFSSDWYNCNGTNCQSQPKWVRVDWTITNGYSDFSGMWAKYQGCGAYSCGGDFNYVLRPVGPSPSSGYQYLTLDGTCTIGLGTPWFWQGGMCDMHSDCIHSHQAIYGPRTTWYWTPPSSGASNVQYWW